MNNMQKHKNNSGFTLVELIVVMCIMGIIMGAVLNFLRPTAQLYNTTNKYLNQEEAVDMIADYLKDDLMYATGVFIIESNQADINAVAQRTNAALTGTPDGKGLDYKNCIVLDNASIRSSGTAAAIRKEATGSVSKYALKNGHYVDVTSDPSLLQGKELYRNTFALQDQSFMGEDQYRFSVESHITEELCSLTVHMEVASLVRDADTDTYKVHEIEYEADKPIEFLNSTSSIVTNGFNVWMDAGEYSGDDYIYIFYNRKDKITQDNVRFKCQFYLMGADGNYMDTPIYETTVVDPADIREEVQKNVDEKNLELIEDENYVYRRTKYYATMPDIYDITDPTVVDLSNVTSGVPGSILKLYAVYTRALKSDEKYTVNFYVDKEKNAPRGSIPDIPFGDDITDRVPEWAGTEQDAAGTTFTVKYWANCDTDAMQSSFNHITSNMDLYQTSHKEFKVSFVKQDGTPATWTDANGNEVDYLRVREDEGIDASLMPNEQDYGEPDDGAGKYSWVFMDGPNAGKTVVPDLVITEPTVIQLSFVPTPAKDYSVSCNFGAVQSGWNNNIAVNNFSITNTGSEDIVDDITIKLKFDCSVAGIWTPAYNYDGCVIKDSTNKVDTTFSGDTVIIVLKFNNTGDTFYPGRTITLNQLTVSLTSGTGTFVGVVE